MFAHSAVAQSFPDAKIDAYVRAAINGIANEEYEKTDSLLVRFKRDFPFSPFPFVYKAANDISRKFNFNSRKYNDAVYYNLSRADAIADSLLLEDDKNIWNRYAKALTLGYWAYFEGLKGNYFSAFDYGSEALDYYDKCLELAPDFTDALIANAIYDYWVSEKLGWLPFVKDNRAKAIRTLSASIKKESYNKNLAVISLFWILMNEKKYDEALQLIKRQSERYPNNRYLLMAYANAEKHFDAKRAAEIYKKALALTLAKKRENRINEIILRHKIAMLEFKLKNYDNASEQCGVALSYNLSDYEKNKLGDRLKKIEKLKENAERRKNNARTN